MSTLSTMERKDTMQWNSTLMKEIKVMHAEKQNLTTILMDYQDHK